MLALFLLRHGMPGRGLNATVLNPDQLGGSMDDLIDMEDIKQEVLHLKDMLRNRALYKEHNIGGGSRALHALHRKACARGQCIIFLDEAQSLFMPRGRGEKKWADDTANTLLSLLDGVQSDKGQGVIWVVASNFDDASTRMDQAMRRRFSVKINFRLPNQNERRELLHCFLSRKAEGCVDWQDLNLGHVAEITANLSPALLQTIVERTSMLSIQENQMINTDLMFRAFERATIGLTDRATSAEKTRQRERVALHELGHFFMQIDPWLREGLSLAEVKQRSPFLKISTESVSKLGALGYVLSASDDRPCARWKSWKPRRMSCTTTR